ncbi:hypothetical protein P7C73_g2584, partial [Tremellales sp. Uapishka_1]
MTSTESKVAIIGAGVFGLSTALHLARKGYKDVTVFDYQPYDVNVYNPSEGCDGASSDVNKIYRCSYGHETEYQDLAFSGRPIWLEWNKAIAACPSDQLPKGITPETKLFVECGFMRISNGSVLSDYDSECLDYLEQAGLRHHQHVTKNADDQARLLQKEADNPESNWQTKSKAFEHFEGGIHDGFLDTSAGVTYADKLDELIIESGGEDQVVKGLRTLDGKEHFADVVIVACGGWTPSVIPEVAGILETTAGSVVTVTLPEDRQDLWDRFSPDNFPVWAYGLSGHVSAEYGGFYGFPRTPEGKIKIGYRGRKWTNYQTHPKTGKRLSVPKTKYTTDRAVNLPKKSINFIKSVVGELLPELKGVGITDTRMCWYTDSLDNSFVIDYVPGYNESLFVCSGGSGHGFKFLPVLGQHVANALEKRTDQFTALWKWRQPIPGTFTNGLDEGEMSGRNLAVLEMAEEKDWLWADSGAVKVGEKEQDLKHMAGVHAVTAGVQDIAVVA